MDKHNRSHASWRAHAVVALVTLILSNATIRAAGGAEDLRQSTASQVAALGHELQHAIEIANQTAAVDPGSIRALYGTIGFAVDDSGRRFESNAARAAGHRVRSD
jgi:hypothetical protein